MLTGTFSVSADVPALTEKPLLHLVIWKAFAVHNLLLMFVII